MAKQRKGTRLLAALAILSLLMTLMPANAYAATWKKTSLKKIGAYDSVTTQKKKSTKIKKKGKYNLVMKGGNGIVRFTAPKTKTYSFAFSNLKSSEVDEVACVIGFAKVSGTSVAYKNVKTKEGTRPRLPMVSSALANGKTFKFDGYTYRSIKTRTGKLKLKKGQSIFIVMQAKDMDDDVVPCTMRMKIS